MTLRTRAPLHLALASTPCFSYLTPCTYQLSASSWSTRPPHPHPANEVIRGISRWPCASSTPGSPADSRNHGRTFRRAVWTDNKEQEPSQPLPGGCWDGHIHRWSLPGAAIRRCGRPSMHQQTPDKPSCSRRHSPPSPCPGLRLP